MISSICYDILVVVVNYNSSHIIGIEKILLNGVKELNKQRDTLLLIVDNNSFDGSDKKLVEHAKTLGIDYLFLRLSKNYGFARAVNMGYMYISNKYCFKYIMLVNNDAVIVPENTIKVIEYLEYDDIGGVQGTIMQAHRPELIDNAGFVIDSLGLNHPVCRGYTIECSRLYFPSYLSGAHSIYKRELIDKIGKLFSNYFEGYFDDRYLGLMAWSKGYKLLHIPLITSYHLGSASYSGINTVFKSPRWFESIVLADLISSSLISSKSHYALITYLLTAVIASILGRGDYLKSLVNAYRIYRKYRRTLEYMQLKKDVNNSRIPLMNKKLLRHHLKGIRIE